MGIEISQEGLNTINKRKRSWWNLKKKLIEIKEQNPNKPILFFDESRFGTKTKTGLGWFLKGSRTKIKIKLGFKNFYLYSSVNPQNGTHFTLLMPNVDTDCMNVFLEELSQEFNDDFILIMDGAGWHKSKDLQIPKNIQIIILPPYCPELNCVERLWKYVKDNTIKNKVFETLENLENEVCKFVKNLTTEIVIGVCG